MLGIAKKILHVVVTMALFAAFLPAGLAQSADPAVIEVSYNNENQIYMNSGDSIAASTTSGVAIAASNLPVDFAVPENGVASIQLNIDWDPSVVDVTSRYISSNASTYFEQKQLGSMTTPGHTSMGFSKSSNYENFAAMDLAYFGIDAVATTGVTSTITVTVILLEDGDIPPNALATTTQNLVVNVVGLTQINVTPQNPSLALGLGQQLTATGVYNDQAGTETNMTDTVTWTSSDAGVASVSTSGAVSTHSQGTATINATDPVSGLIGSTVVTVTAAEITAVTVSPANPSVGAGGQQPFTAEGTYTDETHADITGSVTWASTDETVATITAGGVASALQAGPTTITATSTNDVVGSTVLTVLPPVVTAIQLQPNNLITGKNKVVQFAANGTYSDGSHAIVPGGVTWLSNDETVATIDPATGVATTQGTGTATITGTHTETGSTNTTTITVKTSIEVNGGSILSLDPGEEIVASTTSGVPISVNNLPNFDAPTNGIASIQLNIDWDPSVVNVTSRYISSDASTYFEQKQLGSMTTPGHTSMGFSKSSDYQNFPDMVLAYFGVNATGVRGDESAITVTIILLEDGDIPPNAVDAVALSAPVEIPLRVLQSITVTPLDQSVAAGNTVQYQAMGHFDTGDDDITTTVAWSSSDTNTATINSLGVATGVAAGGPVTITATGAGDISDSTSLTVTDAVLNTVEIVPANPTMFTGGKTLQLSAMGHYSDGTTLNHTADAVWQTTSTTIAAVNAGLVTSGAFGTADQATITATYGGIPATTVVTTVEPQVTAVVVTPATATIYTGTYLDTNKQQFTALADYNDGRTAVDVTDQAVWTSSDTAVANVTAGLATSGLTGHTGTPTIAAQFGGQAGQATLTVIDPTLQTVEVTGPPVVKLDNTGQYEATGHYNNGFSMSLTNMAAWSTNNTAILTIDQAGLATATQVEGAVTINATYGGLTGLLNVETKDKILLTITVNPPTATVIDGRQTTFTADGYYDTDVTLPITDTVVWTSKNTNIATSLGNGVFQGESAGDVTIMAALEGVNGTAQLTVSPAVLDTITLTPTDPSIAKGLTQYFSAQGTYSDGHTENVTAQASWTSNNTAIGAVQMAGAVKAMAVGGPITVTATIGAVSGATNMTVTEALPVSLTVAPDNAVIYTGGTQANTTGVTQAFQANVTYTDGTVVDKATDAGCAWVSTKTAVATVSATGVATSKDLGSAGTTNITATFSGLTDSTVLTTKEPSIASIAVTPDGDYIDIGVTKTFIATATYQSGAKKVITNSAVWTSDSPSVASIVSAGNAKGLSQGSTNINAKAEGKTGSAVLNVNAATLQSIDITPIDPTVIAESNVQLRAVGTYSDQTKVDITSKVAWTSDDTDVANVTAGGLVTTTQAGAVNITATLAPAAPKKVVVTVLPKAAVLQTIEVKPASQTIKAGQELYFDAIGHYDTGAVANLTSKVLWASNTTSVVARAGGLVSSYAPCVANITATMASLGITGSTNLTVEDKVLTQLVITPTTPVITAIESKIQTIQFTATGIYTDKSVEDLTATVAWTSGTPATADFLVGSPNGEITIGAHILNQATTTVTATSGGLNANTVLTVNPDKTPPTIQMISPANGIVTSAQTIQVSAQVTQYPKTVEVEINDGGRVAMTGVGNVYTSTVNLIPGRNRIVVYATDNISNVASSGTIEVDYDALTPEINIITPAEEDKVNTPTVVVTGNVSQLGTVATVYVNGVADDETIPASVGVSPFSVTVNLKEGRNTIVITGMNGDKTGTSGIRTVIRDMTAPVVQITSPVDGSYVNKGGVNVEGTVDDPDVLTVNMTVNGAWQIVRVTEQKFKANVKMQDGTNTIQVAATDALGNTAAVPASITVYYDKTKPQISITEPANKLLTNQGALLVKGTVDDLSIETVQLYVNSNTSYINVTVTDGTFSQKVSLQEGNNWIEATCTDKAGNTGKSGKVHVTLDITAPKITIALSDPTDYMTITIKSNENFGAEPVLLAPYNVPLTKVSDKEYTGVKDLTGITGTQTVTVTGIDEAQNQARADATFIKEKIDVTAGTPTEVKNDTTTLSVTTNTTVAQKTISVTQHTENIAENDIESGNSAGIFLEIVADSAIKDNLEKIYVEVAYDPIAIFAAGIDASTLKLYTFDTTLGKWRVEQDSFAIVSRNVVAANITHLSKFGAFGSAIQTPQEQQTPTAPPAAPTATTVSLTNSGMTSDVSLRINTSGEVVLTTTLTTTNGMVSYTLPLGTVILNASGAPVYTGFGAAEIADPPASPEGTGIVSSYNMLPDGITFNPAITLTMTYDPAALAEGMDESELYISWWDGSAWVALPSVVDTVANVVTAQVSHFTQFAIIGAVPETTEPGEGTTDTGTGTTTTPESPASFTVSDLNISSASVESGDLVTIKVLVTNSGDLSGTYTVTLNLNGVAVESRDVTLAGGASQTVTFTTTGDAAGKYDVSVDDLTGSYTVTEPVTEPDTGTDTGDTGETTQPTTPEPGGMAGWVWALIIIAIVAVLGGVGYWWYRRRYA